MSDVLSHRVVRDAAWVEPVMVAAGMPKKGTKIESRRRPFRSGR